MIQEKKIGSHEIKKKRKMDDMERQKATPSLSLPLPPTRELPHSKITEHTERKV